MKIDWNIVGLIVFTKVCIFLLIFLSFQFFPFNTAYYLPNFIYPKGESVSFKTAYKTWDAQHFLFLSEKGYRGGNDSNAFSPLYPLSISVLHAITRNSFLSGLVVSNICSLIGLYLFYVLASKWFTKKIAYKSLLLLISFPTSFFFSLIYSEALFFLCIMLFFLFLTQKRLFLASLMAFLIPTVRLIGIFICIPFLTWYIFELHNFTLYDEVKEITQKLFKKEALFVVSPLLGLGIVMVFMFFSTGNALAQFDAQKQFISQYSLLSLLNPFSVFRSFFNFPLTLHGFTNSLFDRVFFLGFLSVMIFMIKRVSITFFVFSIVFGIFPVFGGSFMSYMRYIAVIFPLFIVLAKMIEEKKYAFLEFPLFFIFTILQTLFVIMHSLNYWVA